MYLFIWIPLKVVNNDWHIDWALFCEICIMHKTKIFFEAPRTYWRTCWVSQPVWYIFNWIIQTLNSWDQPWRQQTLSKCLRVSNFPGNSYFYLYLFRLWMRHRRRVQVRGLQVFRLPQEVEEGQVPGDGTWTILCLLW